MVNACFIIYFIPFFVKWFLAFPFAKLVFCWFTQKSQLLFVEY